MARVRHVSTSSNGVATIEGWDFNPPPSGNYVVLVFASTTSNYSVSFKAYYVGGGRYQGKLDTGGVSDTYRVYRRTPNSGDHYFQQLYVPGSGGGPNHDPDPYPPHPPDPPTNQKPFFKITRIVTESNGDVLVEAQRQTGEFNAQRLTLYSQTQNRTIANFDGGGWGGTVYARVHRSHNELIQSPGGYGQINPAGTCQMRHNGDRASDWVYVIMDGFPLTDLTGVYEMTIPNGGLLNLYFSTDSPYTHQHNKTLRNQWYHTLNMFAYIARALNWHGEAPSQIFASYVGKIVSSNVLRAADYNFVAKGLNQLAVDMRTKFHYANLGANLRTDYYSGQPVPSTVFQAPGNKINILARDLITWGISKQSNY